MSNYRIEHNAEWRELRIVWDASPLDNTPPKSIPDKESECASWFLADKLNMIRPRDNDFIPTLIGSINSPTYDMTFLKEEKKLVFSTKRSPDPFLLSFSLFIVNDLQPQTTLLLVSDSNTENGWHLPMGYLEDKQKFKDCAFHLLNQLEKVVGGNLTLQAILEIAHNPLSPPNSGGSEPRFHITFVGYVKDGNTFHGSKNTRWVSFQTIQLDASSSGINNEVVRLLSLYEKRYKNLLPLDVLVDSIYTPWTKH